MNFYDIIEEIDIFTSSSFHKNKRSKTGNKSLILKIHWNINFISKMSCIKEKLSKYKRIIEQKINNFWPILASSLKNFDTFIIWNPYSQRQPNKGHKCSKNFRSCSAYIRTREHGFKKTIQKHSNICILPKKMNIRTFENQRTFQHRTFEHSDLREQTNIPIFKNLEISEHRTF